MDWATAANLSTTPESFMNAFGKSSGAKSLSESGYLGQPKSCTYDNPGAVAAAAACIWWLWHRTEPEQISCDLKKPGWHRASRSQALLRKFSQLWLLGCACRECVYITPIWALFSLHSRSYTKFRACSAERLYLFIFKLFLTVCFWEVFESRSPALQLF